MILILQRSATQEAALQQFLEAVQNKSSPQYHQFLEPAAFGSLYGVSDEDVNTITTWLGSQGFRIDRIFTGKTGIEFSGTAGQVEAAFHTSIHRYGAGSEQRYANASAPEIPEAISPVITGVVMNNFGPTPLNRSLGKVALDPASHAATPLFNFPNTNDSECSLGYCFAVTPGDFATIYDTKPLLAAGIDGTGVTIGIVGRADIDENQVQLYRENFLPAYSATNLPHVIFDGPDPGTTDTQSQIEAYLDVEVAGGVAPNATVNYYEGADSNVSNGIGLAITRAVDDNQVSILSVSFGECEAYLEDTYNEFYANLYEQGAAQGITVLASTGDSGSAGCDPPFGVSVSGPYQAVAGLYVSGLASTPYNVAVGGTDFYYPAKATLSTLGNYWNEPSSGNLHNNADWSSAKSYIPEKVWNDGNPVLDQFNASGETYAAGGGGASSCIHYSGTVDSGTVPDKTLCGGGYTKPAWQSGFGSDAVRDLPDVSLFASDGSNYSFTAICAGGTECAVPSGGANSVVGVSGVGGTSVAAPSMAGVMALVVQKTKSRQGQANNTLYPLSKQMPSAFHDIIEGTNAIGCMSGTPDCGTSGYLNGYDATAGYDLATGLGSIDAAVLVNSWASVSQGTTTTTLSITPTTAMHGSALQFTVNVTGGPTSGDIALLSSAGSNGLYVNSCAAFPCTFSYSGLPGGSYSVSARFAGNTTFATSTSAGVPVTISAEASALGIYYEFGESLSKGQVTNINAQTDLVYGDVIEFTAVPYPVRSGPPANPLLLTTPPATGTMTVTDFGNPLTTVGIDSTGKGSFLIDSLSVGKHSLVVSYSGDSSYSASSNVSPSATPLVFTIVPDPAAVYVSPGSQTIALGTTANLTIYVYGFYPPLAGPTGSITVKVGSTTLPTVALLPPNSYGEAMATVIVPVTALAAGLNEVTASYSGDTNYQAGSGTGTIDVVTSATQTDIYTTPYAPVAGQSITITADVYRTTFGIVGYPTGTVTMVLDGSTALGTLATAGDVPDDGGSSANFTASSLEPGAHSVVATYNGDAGDLTSSRTYSFIVAPGSYDFSMSATPVTLAGNASNPSGSSTVTFTLNYPAASNMYVSLSCAGSVGLISCSGSNSVYFYTASSSTTGTVTVSVPMGTAMRSPHGHWPGWMWAGDSGVVLAMLLPIGLRRRRSWSGRAFLCVALLAMAGGLSACGGNERSGIAKGPLAAGNYNVTVNATVGKVAHQVVIPVTVQ